MPCVTRLPISLNSRRGNRGKKATETHTHMVALKGKSRRGDAITDAVYCMSRYNYVEEYIDSTWLLLPRPCLPRIPFSWNFLFQVCSNECKRPVIFTTLFSRVIAHSRPLTSPTSVEVLIWKRGRQVIPYLVASDTGLCLLLVVGLLPRVNHFRVLYLFLPSGIRHDKA